VFAKEPDTTVWIPSVRQQSSVNNNLPFCLISEEKTFIEEFSSIYLDMHIGTEMHTRKQKLDVLTNFYSITRKPRAAKAAKTPQRSQLRRGKPG
jgi:hypothetical protein